MDTKIFTVTCFDCEGNLVGEEEFRSDDYNQVLLMDGSEQADNCRLQWQRQGLEVRSVTTDGQGVELSNVVYC